MQSDERAQTLDVRGDVAEARAPCVHAVVGMATADQCQLLRPPDCMPVAARELRGGIDRIGAAGGEENLAVLERREVCNARGECQGRLVRVAAERRVGGELP